MKRVFWGLMCLLLLGYAWLVWSWWDEGNRDRAVQPDCSMFMHYESDRADDVPNGCLREWIKERAK